MHVVFRYSLIEEMKNLFDLFINQQGNKNLRSVVYPSFGGVVDALYSKRVAVKECADVWNDIEPKFIKALVDSGLTPLKMNVVCFIHSFGCEGWFNVDKNQIHVRTTQSSKENTVDSIMHELLHLVTYEPDMSYEERENLVERFMRLEKMTTLR